jgi:hypothetical protein
MPFAVITIFSPGLGFAKKADSPKPGLVHRTDSAVGGDLFLEVVILGIRSDNLAGY